MINLEKVEIQDAQYGNFILENNDIDALASGMASFTSFQQVQAFYPSASRDSNLWTMHQNNSSRDSNLWTMHRPPFRLWPENSWI
jgi:hypothetical protein